MFFDVWLTFISTPNRTKLELKLVKSNHINLILVAPNRTKLELKLDKAQTFKTEDFAPNRTKLELKRSIDRSESLIICFSQSHQAGIETCEPDDGLEPPTPPNRTKLELKRFFCGSCCIPIDLPIAPSWN